MMGSFYERVARVRPQFVSRRTQSAVDVLETRIDSIKDDILKLATTTKRKTVTISLYNLSTDNQTGDVEAWFREHEDFKEFEPNVFFVPPNKSIGRTSKYEATFRLPPLRQDGEQS